MSVSVEIDPQQRDDDDASPQFNVLGGQFVVGQTVVPFFTAHLSVTEASEYLKTPDELTGWMDGDVELEALFQRQIDHRRVQDKILPYLIGSGSGPDRPRFFNAITIALVPHKNGTIIPFDSPGLSAPAIEGRTSKFSVSAGSVCLGFYQAYDATKPASYEVGVLRWNTGQTSCVAIDGQHRLQALKRALDLNRIDKRMRVCVIFVLPATDFGFMASEAVERNPLAILRSIFIDLNKHAKPVKRSRLILLDDTDPHSLSVRRLIGDKLIDINVDKPIEHDSAVPLGLIDWHTDDAKFESGPYVSTVLMIDRVLQTLLNAKPVTDWSSKSAVESQMKAFCRIDYKPTLECEQGFKAFEKAEEAWQESFAYPEEDLTRITDVVGKAYAPVISKVLTELIPYRDLIAHRGECGMLGSFFSTWWEAKAADDGTEAALGRVRRIQDHLKSLKPPPMISVWEDFLSKEVKPHKDKNLFFTVVFQDAIFDALRRLNGVPVPIFGEEETPPSTNSVESLHWWCDRLISSLNRVVEAQKDTFRLDFQFRGATNRTHHLWLGTFLRSDGTIDYSNQAVRRGGYWLFVIGMLNTAREAWTRHLNLPLPAKIENAVEKFAEYAPDYADRLKAEFGRLKWTPGQNYGAMDRIVRATQQTNYDELSEEELDAELDGEFAPRAELLWKLTRK